MPGTVRRRPTPSPLLHLAPARASDAMPNRWKHVKEDTHAWSSAVHHVDDGALAVPGGLLGPALPARAAGLGALACGQTITVSPTLTADLVGCTGPGLVIGADGVTLDLAGHTIAGDGHAADCPGDAPCYVGVDDSAGYPDVTFMGAARSASSSSASSRQRPHIVCGWSA